MKTKLFIFGCALALTLGMSGCGKDEPVELAGITVSQETVELPYGETYQIVAKTVPDNAASQAFTYTSNNPDVATVSATGVVTITGVGTATITVSNGSFSKTITVTGSLKSITINPAAIPSLSQVGHTLQLSATSEPEIDVTFVWTSENPEIVTVSQTGLVEAKGEGSAKITVSGGGLTKDVMITVGISEVEKTKKGSWLFDDPSDLLKAAIGLPLEIGERGGSVTAANGPTASNKAAFVTKDAWFRCIHGIAANGGTKVVDGETVPCEKVNEFSVMFDVLLPQANDYHALIQHNLDNTGEAGMYLKSNGRVGQGTIGQTDNGTTVSNKWYRFVFSVRADRENNRVVWDYYWNGEPLKLNNSHEAITIDNGRFTLHPDGVVFFGDGVPGENGADASYDDNDLYVAEIAIWDYALTQQQVATLGMFAVDEEE
jgi:hypothetical protein